VIESSDKNNNENSDKNENSKKKEVYSPVRRTYADVVMSQQKLTNDINDKNKRV
jgi:hypothetical protein